MCRFVTRACRSYNSFDPESEACVRNDKIFEDVGPAIASSIKNEQNVRYPRAAAPLSPPCCPHLTAASRANVCRRSVCLLWALQVRLLAAAPKTIQTSTSNVPLSLFVIPRFRHG